MSKQLVADCLLLGVSILPFVFLTTVRTAEIASGPTFCRNELGHSLLPVDYAADTCARCYLYIPREFFVNKFRYTGDGQLYDESLNRTVFSNETTLLSLTFLSLSIATKWQQCCADAEDCCLQSLRRADESGNKSDALYCPRTWDGWSCWPNDVEPTTEVTQFCPKHIYWHHFAPSCRGFVQKKCDSRGNWYRVDGKEWSDYTNCARSDIYLQRLYYSLVTNLITVMAIIPALVIFNYYKQLSSVTRIRVHKHFFTSLVLHAVVSSLLRWYVSQPQDPVSEASGSSAVCLFFSLMQRYFRSATYLWMFSEALYLHQLIQHAFAQPHLKPLALVAYFLPLLTTALYVAARGLSSHSLTQDFRYPISQSSSNWPELNVSAVASNASFEWKNGSALALVLENNQTTARDRARDRDNDEGHLEKILIDEKSEYSDVGAPIGGDDKCWLLPSDTPWHEWIINAPNLAVLLVNALFLVSLIRILCIKASSTLPAQGDNCQGQGQFSTSGPITRSSIMVATRAAILLLPLYGLHYMLIVYRPNISICWMSEVYHYLYLTLDGLQGTAVAVIFCYANNEIKYLLSRSFQRVSSRQRSQATTIYLTEALPVQQQ